MEPGARPRRRRRPAGLARPTAGGVLPRQPLPARRRSVRDQRAYAIAASAVIHDGWKRPALVRKGRRDAPRDPRPVTARGLGGTRSRWSATTRSGSSCRTRGGPTGARAASRRCPTTTGSTRSTTLWSRARGPQTPTTAAAHEPASRTGGELATGAGPDPRPLADARRQPRQRGRLSSTGKFASTPRQLDRWPDTWSIPGTTLAGAGRATHRNVVLYATARVTESRGSRSPSATRLAASTTPCTRFPWAGRLARARRSYAIVDAVKEALPFGGIGFDLMEQSLDLLVEGACQFDPIPLGRDRAERPVSLGCDR